MAPLPSGASEERPSGSLLHRRRGPDIRGSALSTDAEGGKEAKAFEDVEEASLSTELEASTDGSVQEELSNLVDGIAGEDGRIRLEDFEKLSGCSPSILNALQEKLPRQCSWNASQVKEVLLEVIVPHRSRLTARRESPSSTPVCAQQLSQEGTQESRPCLPTSDDLPNSGDPPGADSHPPSVPVLDEAVPSDESFPLRSTKVLTPSGTRTPVSPSATSPPSRSGTPRGLTVAVPPAFHRSVSRLHLERLQRDAPVSADFTFSASAAFGHVANDTTHGGAGDGTHKGTGQDAGPDVASAHALRRRGGGSLTLRSFDELPSAMSRPAGPEQQSTAGIPETGAGTGTVPISPLGRQSVSSGDGGAIASETVAGDGVTRKRSHAVGGFRQGMGAAEATFTQQSRHGPGWLSRELQEVAALLQEGTWCRPGGSTDKIGERSEYVGHGKQARYFERLDNVMEGDSMEQLVKRAKRKAFLYIHNAFPTPAPPVTERGDSPSCLYPDNLEYQPSSSLWSSANRALDGEVAKERARKDSFSSTRSDEQSALNRAPKTADRGQTSNAKGYSDTTFVTAEEEANLATGNEDERAGDKIHQRHSADVDGSIMLDRAHAEHLKMSFLQMADFYLSLCYHMGILFNQEKDQTLEERHHLHETLDKYKAKMQLVENQLKINFELVQQQREQLDTLEKDMQLRDHIDRRREGEIVELQSRLKKEHQEHIEELRKRDEEVEEILRLYDALKRKHRKMLDENAALHGQLESADEKIANLTAAAAKRSANGQSQHGPKDNPDVASRTSLVEEMATLLSIPSVSGFRTYTPPLRRTERGSQKFSFHRLSSHQTDVHAEVRGVSLLEELLKTASEMDLPPAEKRETSSEPETEALLLPSELREEEARPMPLTVAAPQPAPVVVQQSVVQEEDPPLPPAVIPPESPCESASPARRSVALLSAVCFPAATDELACPPPEEPFPHTAIKTVIRRVSHARKNPLLRRWRALKTQRRLASTPQPPEQREPSVELLDLLEIKVDPEMKELSGHPRDLCFVTALGRQALRLQMEQWQRRRERHRSRHTPSGSIIQQLLSHEDAGCHSCSTYCM